MWNQGKDSLTFRRQEAPQPEPILPKSSFNGLLFKQSRRGDVLIVGRTLAARMAAPHSLHLDHLKLSECCLIEGAAINSHRLLDT